MTKEPVYDINGIMKLLPHRPPFLLIDKILELSDSLIVLCEGKIAAYFKDTKDMTETELGEYMLGIKRMTEDEIGGAVHE